MNKNTNSEEDKPINIYSKTSIIRTNNLNDNFNARLRKIISGYNDDFNPLDLGNPSDILLSCGIPNLPIQMSVQRLVDKKLQTNHPFRLVSVTHMPDFLANPIAIFQSKTSASCKVILTEMEDKEINIVVPIEMNRMIGKSFVNSVRSIYPKDNIKDVLQWICEFGLLEYCEKNKILNWLDKQQSNSADVIKLIKDSTKIINNF